MPAPKPHIQRRLAALREENEELFEDLFLMDYPERLAAITDMDPAHRRQLTAMADAERGKLYGEMGRATKLIEGRVMPKVEDWLADMTVDELHQWRRDAGRRVTACKGIMRICQDVAKARRDAAQASHP